MYDGANFLMCPIHKPPFHWWPTNKPCPTLTWLLGHHTQQAIIFIFNQNDVSFHLASPLQLAPIPQGKV